LINLRPASGFAAREWLESYPMTSASQKQRLLTLLSALHL
jgi:hypothetical protein